MIERHPATTILGVRFMYGLRTAGPAIIGTTKVPLAEFAASTRSVRSCGARAGPAQATCSAKQRSTSWAISRKVERELFGAVIVAIVLGLVAYQVWRKRER